MVRRTKARALETREAVISAAVDVFFRRGVAKATLEEIAVAAGVTRGAVYFHFRDKAELTLIIDDRARLPLDELLLRLNDLDVEAAQPDLLEELEAALAASLAGLEADPQRRKELTVLLLRFDYTDASVAALDRQKQADLAVRAACRRIFEAAAARGDLGKPWTPDTAALAVQSLAAGLVQTWLRAWPDLHLATEGVAVVRAMLGSMRAPAAGMASAAP